MQILVNSDHNIEGRQKLSDHFRDEIERTLNRFCDRITRLEVHLSDQNGPKRGPDDKRCVMEAHIEGRHQPTSVTHHAGTLGQAVDGAAHKLRRSLASIIDRLQDHR